jgi:hypothetical protein
MMTIIPFPDGSRGFSLCVFTPFRNQFFPGVTTGWLLDIECNADSVDTGVYFSFQSILIYFIIYMGRNLFFVRLLTSFFVKKSTLIYY